MPIGWVRESGGASSRPEATARNQPIRLTFFEQIAQTAVAVAESIAVLAYRTVELEIWTRWETASNENVCPICGPYAGHVWRQNEGPQPPLHPNCRCTRVFAFTTWKTTG